MEFLVCDTKTEEKQVSDFLSNSELVGEINDFMPSDDLCKAISNLTCQCPVAELKKRWYSIIKTQANRYFFIFLQKKVGIGSTGAVYDALEINQEGQVIENAPLVIKAVFVDFFSRQEYELGYEMGSFIGFAVDETFSYIVMRKENGGELFSEDLKNTHNAIHSSLSVLDQLTICIYLLSAINNMHQKSIIHRDLKGSNVLLYLLYSKIKLAIVDWGTATKVDEKYGWVKGDKDIGTPYMRPPESRKGVYSKSSDIYAAAAILAVVMGGSPGVVYEDDKYDEENHVYPVGYDLCHFERFKYVPDRFLFFLRSMLKSMSDANMFDRPCIEDCLKYFLLLYEWVDCFIGESKKETYIWDSNLPKIEFNLNYRLAQILDKRSNKKLEIKDVCVSSDMVSLINSLSSDKINLNFIYRSSEKMALMDVRASSIQAILNFFPREQRHRVVQICLSLSEIGFSRCIEYFKSLSPCNDRDHFSQGEIECMLNFISALDQFHHARQGKVIAPIFCALAKVGEASLGMSRSQVNILKGFFISMFDQDQLKSLAERCYALVSGLPMSVESDKKRMPLVELANYSLLGLDFLMTDQLTDIKTSGKCSTSLYFSFLQAHFLYGAQPLSDSEKWVSQDAKESFQC